MTRILPTLGRWSLPSRGDAHRPHKNPSAHPPSHTPYFKARRVKGAMFILQREKTGKMKSRLESPFMDLPLEMRLAILEYCAPIPFERRGSDSLDTFLTLLCVSKAIQCEAYVACLPHIPLALWTKKGVHSFRALLYRRRELGCRVRHLWIGTGNDDEEELGWVVDVLRAATQLKSFACGEFLLARAVNAGALAPACGKVTLMNVEKGVEYEARYVTHLRLCAGTYSTQEKFPSVTSLCFNARRKNAIKDERVKLEYEAVDKWVESLEGFAMIERDGKRASSRGLGLEFKVRREELPDMFSVSLPAKWTEWDIWSAGVVGAGVWDICHVMDESPINHDVRPSLLRLPRSPPRPVGPQANCGTEQDIRTKGTNRRRKTHVPGTIDFLRDLPLPVRLQINCDIERENFVRARKQFQHRINPTVSPDDASSIASFVTTTSEDRSLLRDPHVFRMVADTIPFYLHQEMAVDERVTSSDGHMGGTGNSFFVGAHDFTLGSVTMIENLHHHHCHHHHHHPPSTI